jgi:hypothetical protein
MQNGSNREGKATPEAQTRTEPAKTQIQEKGIAATKADKNAAYPQFRSKCPQEPRTTVDNPRSKTGRNNDKEPVPRNV